MSQFCTMPAGERKKRAAAICREVHGSNGDLMDLGKKLSIPKDIMLEELSLLSNRGSRLFKMRQRRSEKYTFENIQNEANMQLSNDLLNVNAVTVEIKVDPPAEDDAANADNAAVSEVPAVQSNTSTMPRSYHSPWEQEILGDPNLAETIKQRMPAPDPLPNLPEYKSFNRVATPFGGFDKAPRTITFKLPELDLNPPNFPELQAPGIKRPSFNRTAQGWITEGTHMIIPTIPLESIEVPESDDL
ncbi:myozenin-2 isoform X1 [Takifugu rubripes]|uniref:Myozenin-2 Calsarcin-1 FATZ-related protein 2 n=2 Tax=Takifugu TaxID=31032 RepID=A0A5C6N228_9TELE|nr:myozenin-2 isoform X1 [Takifugu rubripes]XP_056891464.1 myozenin-2b isoform X1 [Takifugu flavidus]TWW59717.1 Myozenin-2 Calsarcin-1 FATZ-related protein 2 [Takifugu flavidus]|eukprot:XP_003972004.1 PREDICTED: myozenin-2-like [Takifugu rubripes]